MKKLLLSTLLLTLSLSAFAANRVELERRAINLSNRINGKIGYQVQTLTHEELRKLIQTLRTANKVLDHNWTPTPGPVPNPVPVPNPNPYPNPDPLLPKCSIVGVGTFNYTTYNFRVKVGVNIIEATNNLNEAINIVNQMVQQNICALPYNKPEAELKGVGSYSYTTYRYLLKVNGQTLLGANNYRDISDAKRKLFNAGLVNNFSNKECRLIGPGSYSYTNYRQRVTIDGHIVFGANNPSDAIHQMQTFRQDGFCY